MLKLDALPETIQIYAQRMEFVFDKSRTIPPRSITPVDTLTLTIQGKLTGAVVVRGELTEGSCPGVCWGNCPMEQLSRGNCHGKGGGKYCPDMVLQSLMLWKRRKCW